MNGLQLLSNLVPAGWDMTNRTRYKRRGFDRRLRKLRRGSAETLLLTVATPEPGSIALVAVGLVGLAFVRFKSRVARRFKFVASRLRRR